MTLCDILELRAELEGCGSIRRAEELLCDCGEDSDPETAKAVTENIGSPQSLREREGKVVFLSREVRCPKCGNDAPDKLLSNAAQLLSADRESFFGCCECGEQFQMDA